MPLVNRGNHCSVRRRRLRSRNRPKPSVTPFDHFGAAEERSEGPRGWGGEERSELRASGLASWRAGWRASACTDFVLPAPAAAGPRHRLRPGHRSPHRRSARSPAVHSLTFPPSAKAARPSFRLPPAHAALSCFPLPRPSKICRSLNSSFVVRQPRVRLQQCGAPSTSLLANKKVRSRSDLFANHGENIGQTYGHTNKSHPSLPPPMPPCNTVSI